MIHIPENLLEEIFAHAKHEAPNEVCGWLAGKSREVERTYPVVNASETPRTRFAMEPEAQISAMKRIRESGIEIVGTYHSHPRSPAHPSESDLELALYPDICHLIVSLSQGEARWWRISESGVMEA